MTIILSRRGKPARRLQRTLIQEESYLQQYIAANPDVLPLDQLKPDIRPLVLVREFPTPSGSIDALATDEGANLYLIETKLYKNPDKRLVLAQVLDYGAALWKAYTDPDEFLSRLDLLMMAQGGKSLPQVLGDSYGLASETANEFLANLKATLVSGAFRFVVLMDRVDDRLKDLIAYVNANSAFDLLGVGLDFYHDEDLDILIPSLYGAEGKKPTTAGTGTRRTWDEQSLFADLVFRNFQKDCDAVARIIDDEPFRSMLHAQPPGTVLPFSGMIPPLLGRQSGWGADSGCQGRPGPLRGSESGSNKPRVAVPDLFKISSTGYQDSGRRYSGH